MILSIITSLNLLRTDAGLAPLAENSILNQTAQVKACDLKRGYWSHLNPEGKMAWDLMDTFGYSYVTAGENLARNCVDKYCIKLWMKSPTHRDNILDPTFNEIGVGKCGTYKVIHFGSRN